MKNLICILTVVVLGTFCSQSQAQCYVANAYDYDSGVYVLEGPPIDYGCAAQAVLAATQHQCQSQGRWGCMFEKAGVGFASYVQCSGGLSQSMNGRKFGTRLRILRAARRSSRR